MVEDGIRSSGWRSGDAIVRSHWFKSANEMSGESVESAITGRGIRIRERGSFENNRWAHAECKLSIFSGFVGPCNKVRACANELKKSIPSTNYKLGNATRVYFISFTFFLSPLYDRRMNLFRLCYSYYAMVDD